MGRKILLIAVIVAVVGAGVGGAYWLATVHVQKTFQEAKDVLAKGDVPQAVTLFESVYHKRPGSSEGFESLATLCQLSSSLEQKDKALEYAKDFATRAKSAEDMARAKYYMGTALISGGNAAEGASELADILSKYSTSSVADDALLFLAKTKAKDGNLLEARDLLRTIVERYPDSNLLNEVYGEYGKINIRLLFSPTPTPSSVQYNVTSRDTVEGIAKKFGVTADSIRQANGLAGDRIRKGQTLKIDKSKFAMVVSKSRNTLTLLANGELFKIYSVGTGRSNSTPTGDYKIINKLVNPPWYKPGGGLIAFGDQGNLLGTRWLGINLPGYGIHGTWEPDTVGKQSSAGCIRLQNPDVEELFKIVDVGTPVKIVD